MLRSKNGGDQMIYIAGSTYGCFDRFLENDTIKCLTQEDYLIIIGNFGFFHSKEETITKIIENEILDLMAQMPYTILFIDSADEHIEAIKTYPVEFWNGGKVHRIRSNIAHLMRGQVFEIEGKKIFALGGAISSHPETMNKPIDQQNHNLDSLPSKSELAEGWSNLERNDLNVDIVITYTPTTEAIRCCCPMPQDAPYGGEILPFLEQIQNLVQYKSWYFGLLHTDEYYSFELSPLGKYCAEKKMHPVWLKVLSVDSTQ